MCCASFSILTVMFLTQIIQMFVLIRTRFRVRRVSSGFSSVFSVAKQHVILDSRDPPRRRQRRRRRRSTQLSRTSDQKRTAMAADAAALPTCGVPIVYYRYGDGDLLLQTDRRRHARSVPPPPRSCRS